MLVGRRRTRRPHSICGRGAGHRVEGARRDRRQRDPRRIVVRARCGRCRRCARPRNCRGTNRRELRRTPTADPARRDPRRAGSHRGGRRRRGPHSRRLLVCNGCNESDRPAVVPGRHRGPHRRQPPRRRPGRARRSARRRDHGVGSRSIDRDRPPASSAGADVGRAGGLRNQPHLVAGPARPFRTPRRQGRRRLVGAGPRRRPDSGTRPDRAPRRRRRGLRGRPTPRPAALLPRGGNRATRTTRGRRRKDRAELSRRPVRRTSGPHRPAGVLDPPWVPRGRRAASTGSTVSNGG